MIVTRRKVSPVVAAGIGVGIALILAAAGWFLLVSPQRSHAAELDVEIAAIEDQISAARVAKLQADDLQPIRAADLFRLSKAMPSDLDISGVLLELSRIAKETGITFKSIVPGATASVTSFRVQPIELTFEGDFYSLSDFLYRLRNLVQLRDGDLSANGRLFTVDTISFAEGRGSFPNIQASLSVNAFVYGTKPAAAAPPPPPATTTTATTTTPTAPAAAPTAPAALASP